MEYVVIGGMNVEIERGVSRERAVRAAIGYANCGQKVAIEVRSDAGEIAYLNPDGSTHECGEMWTPYSLKQN